MGLFNKRSDEAMQRCMDCAAYYNYALEATTISDYLERWDRFAADAKALTEEPATRDFSGYADIAFKKIMELYNSAYKQQAGMRDIIERQGVISTRAMLGRLKENTSGKVNLYLDVAKEFSDIKERFSEETLDFAQRVLDKLYLTAGKENISRQIIIQEWKDVPPLSEAQKNMDAVDAMNGSAFEAFCAELLERNGFTNVDVLPKTEGPGVDIIAEKDSVRYAFLCKRYDGDLSYTPVQEVYAGKEMYDCTVGVVLTNQHFAYFAKALAEKTNVLLWDRETLEKMMEKM